MSDWLARLKSSLTKSSTRLEVGIQGIFGGAKPGAETLQALEDLLIESDLGARVAARLTAKVARERLEKGSGHEAVRRLLAQEIEAILKPVARPWVLGSGRPHVLLAVGVNGNGKTTTLGKLAYRLRDERKSVALAACDTFRAAAIDQLRIWAERSGADFISGEPHADPASVAYQAAMQAKAASLDALLIDSAGRLYNQANLMAELQKLVKVLGKIDSALPHSIVQMLDATTGQNALVQVEAFRAAVPITGLIVTKLDGTAKGGVVVALAEKFGLPLHALGVGEGAEDLRPFAARDFARALVGLPMT